MEWNRIWKPLEKFLIAGAELIIALIFVYFTENGHCLWLIPVLELARNHIKHKYWKKEVKKKK